MTSAILISLGVLVLIAYSFDITASRTRIPSVILLLALGWAGSQLSKALEIDLPDITSLLPVLGTTGLILIVLEGSLDLELNRAKLGIIRKSIWTALVPFVVVAVLLAAVLHFQFGYGFQASLANVIPLCVISSAIAIPTARNLHPQHREFIVFESSMSDIFGVIGFNLVATEVTFSAFSLLEFGWQLLAMLLVSFLSTALLAFLLTKIKHHVKFTPIIFSLLLIYGISKEFHLPALIFVLMFGLFLGNLDEVAHFKFLHWLKPAALDREVHKFKEIVAEGTFLVRVLFFLLFGYSLETAEILNVDAFAWTLGIVALILAVRAIQLLIMRMPLLPFLFFAPRGLITVLLFLSIPPSLFLPEFDRSLVIQVILLTALLMMVGLLTGSGKSPLKELLFVEPVDAEEVPEEEKR